MKLAFLCVLGLLLCHDFCEAKNRKKKDPADSHPGWAEHEIGALHANAHHGADVVAKNLKKPQKEVDKKMKELGYHVHVP